MPPWLQGGGRSFPLACDVTNRVVLLPRCGRVSTLQTFRNILVAVVGLAPQVSTETLYDLTQVQRLPIALNGIHVVTTQSVPAEKSQIVTP